MARKGHTAYKLCFSHTNFIFAIQTLFFAYKLYFCCKNFIFCMQTLFLPYKLYFCQKTLFFPTNFTFCIQALYFHTKFVFLLQTLYSPPQTNSISLKLYFLHKFFTFRIKALYFSEKLCFLIRCKLYKRTASYCVEKIKSNLFFFLRQEGNLEYLFSANLVLLSCALLNKCVMKSGLKINFSTWSLLGPVSLSY